MMYPYNVFAVPLSFSKNRKFYICRISGCYKTVVNLTLVKNIPFSSAYMPWIFKGFYYFLHSRQIYHGIAIEGNIMDNAVWLSHAVRPHRMSAYCYFPFLPVIIIQGI